MLSLPPSSPSKSLKPNLLPCTIHHSGPIGISPRHWNPSPSTTTSSFRGRKLLGKPVRLPTGYTGAVLRKTEKILARPQLQQDEEEEEEEEEPVEVKRMEQVGAFEEIVVWGHETVPGDGDVHVKGIQEWIGFAEAMNTHEQPRENHAETLRER